MSKDELSLTMSFLCGASSSTIAEAVTFPMDMLKTRMQMGGTQGVAKYQGIFDSFRMTYKQEGFYGFYKGASPALIRQFFYSGIRIAIFEQGKKHFGYDEKTQGFWARFLFGGLGGGVASLVATPLDVSKIRLINDAKRERYNGLLDCLVKTYKSEGLFYGFYKGSSPNVYRALLINATSLATYDTTKNGLSSTFGISENGLLNRFLSSFVTGFLSSLVSSPIDVVKSRYMNSIKAEGMPRFKGPTDCFLQILKNEGVGAMYNGFWFLWLRIGPWAVIMFITWDWMKDLAKINMRNRKNS
jgi:hypothetical protein